MALDWPECCGREESLDAEHSRRVFVECLTSLLPLLGKPSYNGTDCEEDPVAATPLAASAKDCLQAVCNLLGPQAYIGIAAQLFLHGQGTGIDGVHLAEVTEAPPYSSQLLPSLFLQSQIPSGDPPLVLQIYAVCMLDTQVIFWLVFRVHQPASVHADPVICHFQGSLLCQCTLQKTWAATFRTVRQAQRAQQGSK